MLGEKEPTNPPSFMRVASCLLLFIILAPLVGGAIFGLIPMGDPSLGFISSFGPAVLVAVVAMGPGMCDVLLVSLGAKVNVKTVAAFTLTFTVIINISYFVLGEMWMFPTPMGYLIAASIGFPITASQLFYQIFGKKIFTDWALIKRLAPLIAVPFLCITFTVVFAFYRAAFIQMTPSQQALFGPVWPLLKLGLKKCAAYLVDAGGNPDAAPFMLFFFDVISALCGNFLFISAADVGSVFSMISVDIVENLILACRVTFLIQRSRNERHARLERERDAEFLVLKNRLSVHSARLTRLENINIELANNDALANSQVDLNSDLERQSLLSTGGDDDREAAIGMENLHMHRACRLLINFLASEMSEMVCSGWSMIMLPMLYYSNNKQYFYTIDTLDSTGFQQALTFSAIDFALEAFTFALMLLVFALHANINVYHVGIEYIHMKGLFLPLLKVGFAVVIVAFAFFEKHNGIDPEFKWDEFGDRGGGGGNSSALSGT
ncbi:hypothetical protein TrRE_jg11085 [Triparma retinervis]|uniref:Uncharacterized protein n=1 Tax=Triparma retinervis TaxID=2557542 RepID=A0A9W7A9R3_9STRA|nr:hypothetical protein TrRE_jg11085 [Triparma retinervis]